MSSAGTDPCRSVDDEDLVDDDDGDTDGGDDEHRDNPDLVLRGETPACLHLSAVLVRTAGKCLSRIKIFSWTELTRNP